MSWTTIVMELVAASEPDSEVEEKERREKIRNEVNEVIIYNLHHVHCIKQINLFQYSKYRVNSETLNINELMEEDRRKKEELKRAAKALTGLPDSKTNLSI